MTDPRFCDLAPQPSDRKPGMFRTWREAAPFIAVGALFWAVVFWLLFGAVGWAVVALIRCLEWAPWTAPA